MDVTALHLCEEEATLEGCGAGAPVFDLDTMDVGTSRALVSLPSRVYSCPVRGHASIARVAPLHWPGCAGAVVLHALRCCASLSL
jgi:hypothetical protein